MITVSWKLADGTRGESILEGDDKWSLGRAGEDVTVELDDPAVSRTALTIRDSGPGPVVFRGQRDNGARVALVSLAGVQRWIDEGMAANITADENRVEFYLGTEPAVTIDVAFTERGTVVERRDA